jgi:hypothetical protein
MAFSSYLKQPFGLGVFFYDYRVAAINPEQLQSFAGALKVVFLY